jgi:hypothetical protein
VGVDDEPLELPGTDLALDLLPQFFRVALVDIQLVVADPKVTELGRRRRDRRPCRAPT